MKRILGIMAVAALFAVALLAPASAQQGQWTILPLTGRGVDTAVVETFGDLLQNELSTRSGAGFVSASQSCQDVPCAAQVGNKVGAAVAVFGSMNALGAKIIVSVTVVDTASGEVSSNQKITVDQIEDLDAAAARIAEAIVTGSSTRETAELGNITANEARPERRREGQSGLGLRVGGLAPLSKNGYAEGVGGVLIDMSYWYETSSFAIEPRIGLRFSADNDEGSFSEIPMDLGAYYILTNSDFAPFIGGGGGLRFMSEERRELITVGTIVTMTSENIQEDSGVGFSAFARAGLLLFRTYTMRVALTADYNITFIKLNGLANPQSLTAGIGVFF